MRRSASSQLSSGMLETSCANSLILSGRKLLDAAGRQLEQLVEAGAAERRLLRGRLYLDERTVAGGHDVHVHLGRRVLRVVEVEERRPLDDAHGDSRDRSCE